MSDRVIADVLAELDRQVQLRDAGRFAATIRDCAVCGDHLRALAILVEEVGEVSTEALSVWPVGRASSPDAARAARARLRAELIQVAACAVSWVQGVDVWSDDE